MDEASYVLYVAKSTGWPEHFIRWELPLARGRAYDHASLLMAGHEMRWPDRSLHPLGRWWQGVLTRRNARRHGKQS